MKLQFNALVALTILGLFAQFTDAAPWSVTTVGTIGNGEDTTGTFFNGAPHDNLAGLAYTETTTVDPALYGNPLSGIGYIVADGSNDPFSVTLTINDVTLSFTSAGLNASGGTAIQNSLGGLNEFAQNNEGDTTTGSYLQEHQSVVGTNPQNFELNFNQSGSYTTVSSDGTDSSFYLIGLDEDIFFTAGNQVGGGTISSISVAPDPNANLPVFSSGNIPEPSSLPLIFVGLAALFAAMRSAKFTPTDSLSKSHV